MIRSPRIEPKSRRVRNKQHNIKIFSSYEDYGYEEERLYSVLMTEDELVSLFSEDEKKMSTGAKVGLGVAGATAATGLGIYGAKKLGEKLEKTGKLKLGQNLQKPANAISKLAKRVIKR